MLDAVRAEQSAAERKGRGRRIGANFQDPLTSLHPMLTIGDQLVGTIVTHLPLDRRAGTGDRAVRRGREPD